MSVLANSNAIETGGYNINNSLRFRSSASAYLSRTPASTTNRRTFTYSFWYKRGEMSTSVQFLWANNATTYQTNISLSSDSGPASNISVTLGNGSAKYQTTTTAVFRDPSAWYHIVVAVDTTQATSSNRLKIYVNGEQQTSFSNVNYPPQNFDTWINSNSVTHYIGAQYYNGSYTYTNGEGYLAEVNFIDGQQLTPSSFGATDVVTGVWAPKAYTGTYGTNGFYLKFSDIATTSGSNAGLGKDFSGNTNYWTTNNISVTAGTTYDAMTDSPTLTSSTVGNYCVLNPLDNTAVLSEANLKATYTGAATWHSVRGSVYISSGKYYWEVNVVQVGYLMIGVASPSFSLDNTYGSNTYNWTYFQPNGNKYGPGIGGSGSAYGASYTAGDVIGVALDMDAGTITFYKNNTSQGTAFTGITGLVAPVIALDNETGSGGIAAANFGQRPFSYTPPTGFNRLNTFNLPDSTIKKGNSYMDATLYTGNGSTLAVTNAGSFKPDAVWLKCRSTARNHNVFDSNRGTTKRINPNLTDVEDTASGVTSFDTGGFTLGSNTVGNTSGDTYVAWQWQAGQGTTSSNTQGSITSTVSVNTTAGFSIVTWTGTGSAATVGHGLGVAPKMVISKKRNGLSDWAFWITGFAGTELMELNSTAAKFTGATVWNSTTPTSTVFSVGSATQTNNSGGTYVAYLWSEIAGFSKFGSYTGNGSADGPFIFTGFRPKWIMIKRTDSISNWAMFDTSRSTYNLKQADLYANLSDAEATNTIIPDILSNGFKVRTSNATWNTNGGTWIYAAFSENPFKNSLAR